MRTTHLALVLVAAVAGLSSIARTQGIPAGVSDLQQQVLQLKQQNADLAMQLAEAQALSAKDTRAGIAKARELLAQYRAQAETADTRMLQAAAERDRAVASIAQTRSVLAACQEKNNRVIDVSREILKAYDNTGFFDAVFEREPVLGIKRVELENIAQDRSDRIEEGRFTMPADPVNPAASKP